MILLLDDDQSRIDAFKSVIKEFSDDIVISWSNAPTMIAEVSEVLPQAKVISLDHDLYKLKETDPDPGTGRDVAEYLANHEATCPIIIHSTNVDASWGMYNTLTFSGWRVEILHYTDEEWFGTRWLPMVKSMLE
ncbi:MAG: hypothetical protein EP297_14410 [Gammaproteobacteria bacterium]|nr:MAG: hypothetical protein EP297_14410 [Gammaproteobacteria bacterium]